jgi:hypothetical protein
VSLNRSEQALFEYVEKHPEERQFWMQKVRSLASVHNAHAAADRLEIELWHYFRERSANVPILIEFARHNGLQRTSMRNLAEYWLRSWGPVRRPVPKTPEAFG